MASAFAFSLHGHRRLPHLLLSPLCNYTSDAFSLSELVNPELDQELHLSHAGLIDEVIRYLKLTLRKGQRDHQEEEGGSSNRSRITEK